MNTKEENRKLVDLTLKEFTGQLAGDLPAPGGGSVAALAGSLASALCAMVSRLTVGREKYRDSWAEMERVRDKADRLVHQLLELVDRDTDAYNRVVEAFRLPKGEKAEQVSRKQAIQDANKWAARIPMETLRTVSELAEMVESVLKMGNPNCITDAGVAAQLMGTAALGAAYNVRINLSGIDDKEFSGNLEKEVKDLVDSVQTSVARCNRLVEQGLK